MAPRKNQRRLFAYVAAAAFAIQLIPEMSQGDAFAAPQMARAVAHQTSTASANAEVFSRPFVAGIAHEEVVASSRTARNAAAASAGMATKIINAMGAGAVASVIQAALSAVGEPIVNRVLVKRMSVSEAIGDVSPAMMLDYFKTTLSTNFLKFPFFEAINMFCSLLPISGTVRGFITGIVFTTLTLPVTNYRYRKSMQLEVNWGNIYEAYTPTVIRDIAYGIVRNYSTIALMALKPEWAAASPQVLFIVVILGCLGSAPFNEWRGYLLQPKESKKSFSEFFVLSNVVRSTSLGAFKQGLALGVGYWCAPPVQRFVSGLLAGARGA
eukprot:TRINITY_DN1533_c0_g1_i1.p1 TRINITY_DN1533_c0_g1~~TRINITY_DN1533_c0_g1_i1.p1  ORF type:complete len:346 (-),score=86.92 TRINITY_DN1533_c0_g1_i1:334-1308(-)